MQVCFLCFALLGCLLISTAWAADLPPADPHSKNELAWLIEGFLSHHFRKNGRLRDENYGLGVQVPVSDALSVTAGFYRNSFDSNSSYMGYLWQPISRRYGSLRAKAGFVVTVIDGYRMVRDGQWFLAAVPVVIEAL